MSVFPESSPRAPSATGRSTVSAAAAPRWRLFLLLCVGLALIGAAWFARSSRWTRDFLLRGKDLSELEAIVRSRPDDPVAQYYLGKRYYMARRFSEAEGAYESALKADPNWARARLGLGLALMELGKVTRAEEELEYALKLDDRLAWAEYTLGKLAWSRGNIEEALPHVRRATELDQRSDEAWYGLGVCNTQQRKYPEAIAALRNAVSRKEGSAKYHTALGELLAYRGQAEEGRAHYERALELDPHYGPACALMGRFLLQNGAGADSLDRAQDLLERASTLRTLRPAETRFNLGQLYVRKGLFPQAVASFKDALARDPRDERTYYGLANAYRRMGREREADETDRKFRRISALHVQLQGVEARVRHNPDDASLHMKLARLYRDLSLPEKAAEQYEICLHLAPPSDADAREIEQFARKAGVPPPAADSDFVLSLPDK